MQSRQTRSTDSFPVVLYLRTEGCSAAGYIDYLSGIGISVGTVSGYAATANLDDELAAATVVVIGGEILDHPGAAQQVGTDLASAGVERLFLVVTSRQLTFSQRSELSALGQVKLFRAGDDMKAARELVRDWMRSRSMRGYRVLLVEDSKTDAYLATKYMVGVGIEVKHLASAELVLDAMAEFEPDLIVSDLHMPGCAGDQMARVIRQDRDATLPILFLSSEADSSKQLIALAAGADGFIRKPLVKEPFIQALKSTIQRSVALENRMRRDPLTSLLNRGQFMNSMRRLAEQGEQASVVILDIDHFKRVNDTYGHPVGDQVICALAQVLQDGLRSTDYIGRVGGEEFGVVMPGCSTDSTAAIMRRMLDQFGALIFQHGEGARFSCAFSAGVTQLGLDSMATYKRADESLYESKEAGRARVTVNPWSC